MNRYFTPTAGTKTLMMHYSLLISPWERNRQLHISTTETGRPWLDLIVLSWLTHIFVSAKCSLSNIVSPLHYAIRSTRDAKCPFVINIKSAQCFTRRQCGDALRNFDASGNEIWNGETGHLIVYLFQKLQMYTNWVGCVGIRHDCNIAVPEYLRQSKQYMVRFHITNRNEEQIFQKIYLIKVKGKTASRYV